MITVRDWTNEDDFVVLTQLLNLAYKQLADLGLKYTATWQDSKKTEYRMDGGRAWLAETEGKYVGTVTAYPPGLFTDCDYYHSTNTVPFGMFAVHPEHQGKGIGKLLIEKVMEYGREVKAETISCDTAETADHLIEMYLSWGFEFVGEVDYRPSVNYKSVVLAKLITD